MRKGLCSPGGGGLASAKALRQDCIQYVGEGPCGWSGVSEGRVGRNEAQEGTG